MHGKSGVRNGFQPRCAKLIDRHRRDARLVAVFQFRLTCRILAKPGLHHVAEDRLVHLLALEAGAPHGFGHNLAAEFRGRETRKPTLKFSDCRANSGENDWGFHGNTSRMTETQLYRYGRKSAEGGRPERRLFAPAFRKPN